MSIEQRIERIEAALGLEPAPAPIGTVGLIDAFAVLTIARHICREMQVDITDLISHRRFRHVSRARYAVCWLAKHNLDRTLPQIGRALGIDHSSVIHGIRQAEALIQSDMAFALIVDLVQRRLFGKGLA